MKKTLKILWTVLGFLCLGLGSIGIVLPILPTVPFYMATVFCFAKSSETLHRWFIQTNLYKKYLDSFVKKKAMTRTVKLRIMIMVTVFLYEKCTGWKDMYCGSVGFSSFLSSFQSEDSKTRKNIFGGRHRRMNRLEKKQ